MSNEEHTNSAQRYFEENKAVIDMAYDIPCFSGYSQSKEAEQYFEENQGQIELSYDVSFEETFLMGDVPDYFESTREEIEAAYSYDLSDYEVIEPHERNLPSFTKDDLPMEPSVNRNTTKKIQPPKLDSETILGRLFDEYCIINIGGNRTAKGTLYLYEEPLYVPVGYHYMVEKIRDLLTYDEKNRMRSSSYQEIYNSLFTYSGIKIEQIPIYPGEVVFENGIFDIRTSEKIESSPDRIYTHQIHARYLPDSYLPTPVWDQFLESCTGGDQEIKDLILAWLGWCLLPEMEGKCFFVLGPAPDSGKSVLGDLLQNLVGVDMVSNVPLQDLKKEFALEPLVGKLLNISMDLPRDPIDDRAVSATKLATGKDRLNVNKKYCDMFAYQNRAKLIFGCNSRITLQHEDAAFWNRFRLIPFLYSVPEEQKDLQLLDKLLKERDGIVTKAMAAARELIKNNYCFPKCRAAEKLKLQWQNNDEAGILAFVKECCDRSNPQVKTHTDELYKAYQKFCRENKIGNVATQKAFSQTLLRQFSLKPDRWKTKMLANAQRGFWGIQLKTPVTSFVKIIP